MGKRDSDWNSLSTRTFCADRLTRGRSDARGGEEGVEGVARRLKSLGGSLTQKTVVGLYANTARVQEDQSPQNVLEGRWESLS